MDNIKVTKAGKPILLDDSNENANWIKTIVGKDGKTAKQREEEVYQELKKEFANKES